MLSTRFVVASALLLFTAVGAHAQSSLIPVNYRESGALYTNDIRCQELNRQFDVAAQNASAGPDFDHASALRNEGAQLCAANDYAGGVAKIDEALGMLGHKPYGSAE